MSWKARAACKGMDTNLFYDDYENSEVIAKQVDQICLQCPVRDTCLMEAVHDGETGVFGSTYLVRGNYSRQHNKHKDKPLASALQIQVSAFQKHGKAVDD